MWAIGLLLASAGCGPSLTAGAAARSHASAGGGSLTASAAGLNATRATGDEVRYAVGTRTLWLSRGTDRPLPTLIFYPATGPVPTADVNRTSSSSHRIRPVHAGVQVDPNRSASSRARSGSGAGWVGSPAANRTPTSPQGFRAAPAKVRPSPARGRFPLVLFSHGLRGTPRLYAETLVGWASAGFVVAAPIYPHTHVGARYFDRGDIVNQPADAAYAIKMLRLLDRTAGDPLAGHIDADRVAAVGHSAGGYTTTGLFAARHPTWLRAGVVIAGWLAPGAFQGPPATILFVQGARDKVVPVAQGRAAYDAVPWWKSYVLLPDSWHADYMLPTGAQYPLMNRTVLDFLRWTLTGDEAAGKRLPPNSFGNIR